jgi:superfamily II DNA or RNA helicase
MIPSYRESIFLQRGSGYFTLSSLILSISGIVDFIDNGGVIHLVCNPDLSPDDINFIIAGHSLDKEHITESLLRQLETEGSFSDEDLSALDIICNMISEKRLIIKVAFMPVGIYHEKIGIFTDEQGNKVYYNGSANETANAKLNNAESLDITTSWSGDSIKIELQSKYFDDLWNDRLGERIQVIDFPEAVKNRMFTEYKKSEHLVAAIETFNKKKEQAEHKPKELYPYQRKAIEQFVSNGYAHFYEMATGTGKTFTSVKTVERVISEKGKLFVVVCVPQKDLQAQWKMAFEEIGLDNIYLLGGDNSGKTDESFSEATISFIAEGRTVICICVNDTFFEKIYNKCDSFENLFIIADEAHNLTPSFMAKMPINAKFKLGLSATLERFNQAEADSINQFFTNGSIQPYYFGIEEAIEHKFLSRYEYYPIIVHLTDEEEKRYRSKSKAIALELSAKEPDLKKVQNLRTDRSLIIKQASNKLKKLKEMVKDYPFSNSVVYCGQGKEGEDVIINLVTTIIHNAGYRVSQFTSNTKDRAAVLRKFSEYYFDVLVAIKCFDEGVDVPKLDKIYIMASDGSLRQTVQRRGRVLRKCAESGKTIATIYDMIVLPQTAGEGFKPMVVSEMIRAREYNRLAQNHEDNDAKIQSILNTFNITEEDFSNEDQPN